MVPVSGVQMSGRVRNWSWMIYGGLVLGGLSLVWQTVSSLTRDTTAVQSSSAGNARYAGLAGAAAKAWLNGQPIPGTATDECVGDVAPFESVASASWQRMTPTTSGGEVHRFVVVADSEVWYLSVSVRKDIDPVTNETFAVVDGCPTLSPFVGHAPVAPKAPWAGWPDAVPAPDRFVTQAEQWADAYFSDSPEALYRMTGDTDSSHEYQPVGGLWSVKSVEMRVISVNADKTAALGQVTVVADRGSFGFDLLFGDPAAALPPVVAWGPSGDGARLTPLANATKSAVVVPVASTTTTAAAATSTTSSTTLPDTTTSAVPAQPTTVAPTATSVAPGGCSRNRFEQGGRRLACVTIL